MGMHTGAALSVAAATHVVIPGSRKLVAPKFIAREGDLISVAWWGPNQEAVPGTPPKKSAILQGLTWLPGMMIGPGENHLYLLAANTSDIPGITVPVTIDYRGGIL